MAQFTVNSKALTEIVKMVIDTEGVERMQRVADACNAHIDSDGYMVSVEGDNPLDKRDYRATVITANAEAMVDNAKHNRLVSEFFKGGGVMFPYAPKVTKDYLETVLDDDVRVSTKVPADRPARLVTITTAPMGDGNNSALSSRRLIISCWSPREETAGELAETVFSAMRKAKYVPGNGIRNVTVVGTPARLDFPDDPTARFQMTVDVLLRAQ